MNRGVLESQAVKLHATYKIKFGSKKIRSNRHKHQSQAMKHGCVSGLGYGCGCRCGTRQFLKKVGAGAAGLGD